MARRSAYTSDDLQSPVMGQPLTRRDLLRFFRSALEKNPSPPVEATIKLLMQVMLEDSGFGETTRRDIAQELDTASPDELVVMRDALLQLRTERFRATQEKPTSSTPTSPSGNERQPWDVTPELYECATCSSKPGSPTLCGRCIGARTAAGGRWKGPRT